MNPNLALIERRVPRYTSYPTVPHFTAEVGAKVYAGWLDKLPEATTLSLYIHIPFCEELCLYCGCHTRAVRRRDPIDRYINWLLDEIKLVGSLIRSRSVVHLHWGGGTPSIIGDASFVKIVENIAQAFDVSMIKEHAIELDPRRVTRLLARTLATIGINRVSLGIQEFSPRVQNAIGRIQPLEVVEQAVDVLREENIDHINVDLMYGLPRQTSRDVMRSAILAASFNPDRLALFGYAHVPWLKKHQRLIDQTTLPDPTERIAQTRIASDTLVSMGYARVGLDHFAYPTDELAVAARLGRMHRNFQGYTTDDADVLIGLGTSAISRLPQGFVQNAVDTASYARAIEGGRLATARGIALTPDDCLRGWIIERLMCDLSVDFDTAGCEIDSEKLFASEIDSLRPLEQAGLVFLERRRISVTEMGRPYVRLVAATFDSYLTNNLARYSIAV